MITRSDVRQFISTKPLIAQNVFNSITAKDRDDEAIVISTATARTLMKNYGRTHSLLSVVDDDSLSFLGTMTIDEVESIAEVEGIKVDNSLQSWLFVKPFHGLWLRVAAHVYGLDVQVLDAMHRNDRDAYGSVGDGVFWAGFYFLLEK